MTELGLRCDRCTNEGIGHTGYGDWLCDECFVDLAAEMAAGPLWDESDEDDL